MNIVPINNLKEGMILAQDIRDVNGRLLLTASEIIQSKHIRVLKIWGITEAPVVEGDQLKEETIPAADASNDQAAEAKLLSAFSFADLGHPAIAELYRLAREHRFPDDDKPVVPSSESAEDPVVNRPRSGSVLDFIEDGEIKLPELPSVVFELNVIMADPKSSAECMAAVISQSATLTTLLLKLVNSPLYGLHTPIKRITQAVTMIGTREISTLALGISVIKVFKQIAANRINMQSFLRHSLACGLLSRALASQIRWPYAEELFVAGLLHDVGRLVLYLYFPTQAKASFDYVDEHDVALYTAENKIIHCDHAHIAGSLLQKWHLPFELENIIAYHHQPHRAQAKTAAAVVHLADIMTHALAIGTSGETKVPPLNEQAWRVLGLSPSSLENVVIQATHQLGGLLDYWEAI
jgi:putative nucleotidyltransferase with HDIG domain